MPSRPALALPSLRRRPEDSGDDDPASSSIECFACTQVGVPAFHSMSCDAADRPQWEASAGSSLFRPVTDESEIRSRKNRHRPGGPFGRVLDPRSKRVLDPRSKRVKRWNRALVLARGFALALDPLFLYVLSFAVGRGGSPCVYVNGEIAAIVTVLRTCVDSLHLCHVWLQFKVAYVSKESLVVGCGKLVWDARAIASHYLRSLEGFWFDVFVVLPIPQVLFWLVIPKMIAEEKIKMTMTILQLIILFQFFPRAYHFACLTRRMQKVTGYIFSSIWWRFGLNFIAYWLASHVAGGIWYSLSTQRVVACLQQQCDRSEKCELSLSCAKDGSYGFWSSRDFSSEFTDKPLCADEDGPFGYGIYGLALPVIFSDSIAARLLYPVYWGLLNLSSFGNELSPTSDLVEVSFSISIVILGLLLLTVSIGNIQIFLSVMMSKKKDMSLSKRDMEWWMRRRQLPSRLQKRVHRFERQRWEVMGGEDEMELIKDLPEGLRRDIKRHLCLDLIKKVPFFHNLDDLILDNICDRVTPLVFSKDEKVIREGDPVQRMIFIVAGRVKSIQSLSKSTAATIILDPGSFLGDELLSWSLRRPFKNRLPASSATYVCLESTEAFGIDSSDLRYITVNFRYKFANGKIRRAARYYSSTWRTWAAVNIQFAWRRYKARSGGPASVVTRNGSRRIRHYAALLLCVKPQDHLD